MCFDHSYCSYAFDRAGLSEIVDCRRCSTLFDFSEVTEDVSFAELIEFPRVVFFGSTRFFSNYSDFRRSPKMIALFVELVGFQIYRLLERCSVWCRISEDILSMVWQCSSRISGDRVFNNVRFSRRLSQITEDPLFVELGGFPKINFFDTAQFAEFVGWPKMFDNVPFFSEIIQAVDP